MLRNNILIYMFIQSLFTNLLLQNVVGAEGTEYVQLSGAKPPDRNGEEHTPRTSAFNKVEIYASIDHSGTVPAPPLPPKSSSVY